MGREKNKGIDEQRKVKSMEVANKTFEIQDEIRYQRARKKVREMRNFYINLSLFSIFIPIIITVNLYFVPDFHWFWFSIMGWGTGVAFHGLSTFEIHPFMKNNWEERKIQQFMKEDLEREQNKNNFKKK